VNPPGAPQRALLTLKPMDPSTSLVISGPPLLAVLVALAAGAVSFASPCVVPLVPGYLAYLAGLVGADVPPVTQREAAGPRTGRWRVAGAAGLFVLGFTAVFGVIMVGVVRLADALTRNTDLLQRLGGVLTIVMGLAFVGLVPVLSRERRVHLVPKAGLWGAPLLGALFGLGWVPCIGPTLAGVVAVAAGTGGGSLRGVALTLAYCAGLGVPFVVIAVGAARAVRALAWLRRHVRAVQVSGGALLVVVGVLLVTGLWGQLVAGLQVSITGFTPPI
jgi:cytochrome c-type biogenesis protein